MAVSRFILEELSNAVLRRSRTRRYVKFTKREDQGNPEGPVTNHVKTIIKDARLLNLFLRSKNVVNAMIQVTINENIRN
jgi:hypothetical protein